MPQEPNALDDQGNPVYNALDDSGNPVTVNDKGNILSKAWSAISEPLTRKGSEFAKEVSNYITDPNTHLVPNYVGDAKLRGFIGGSIEGLGGLLDDLTSPISLATFGTAGVEGMAGAKGLSRLSEASGLARKALSGTVAAHGASRLIDPNMKFSDKLLAIPEIAGGLAGMSNLPIKKPINEIVEEGINPVSAQPEPVNLAPITPVSKPKVKLNSDGTYSPINEPLVRLDSQGNKLPGVLDKLTAAIKNVKPLPDIQAGIYSAERSKRVGSAESVETPGEQGFYERLGRLKGEHTKLATEPLKLEQADVDSLFDHINEARLPFYQRINASTGLSKILQGQVPQESEIRLMERVFGKGVTDEMRAALPKINKRGTILSELVNIPKSLMASWDISFGGRQGLGLIHTKSWWTNMWKNSVKALGSEGAYNGIMDNILDRPNFKRTLDETTGKELPSLAEKSGLAITDLGHELSNREEQFASSFAEKFPGVKQSERSYTAASNTLRADNFDALIEAARRIYQSAKETGKARRGFLKESFTPEEAELLNPDTNLALSKSIADYVNTASGRGSLGSLEKYAVGLNNMFFSPRMIASRVKMLNPMTYVNADPFIRKQYLKSMLGLISAWGTFAGMAKAAGADVNTDMNSSDFGKVKIGNTRFDPAGGFQQYLVLFHRLLTGKTIGGNGQETELGSGFGKPTAGDIITRFVRNKLSPTAAFTTDPFFANNRQPFDISDRIIRLFTPMIMQDLSDLLQNDPTMAKLLGLPLSAAGMGVQTYDERGQDTSVIPGISGPMVTSSPFKTATDLVGISGD